MSSVNKVFLLGRLGKDPDVRALSSGVKVANFSLATSEKWKDKDSSDWKEKTEWHNCVAWRGLAEVIEKYVKKGDLIHVEGKLTTEKWEKEGVTHYSTKIIVDQMTMCGSRGGNGGGERASGWGDEGASSPKSDPAFDEASLPF